MKGYQIFENTRKHKEGGGIAIGIDNSLNLDPVLVSQSESDEVELMVVQIKAGKMPIRTITGYGPQKRSTNTYD